MKQASRPLRSDRRRRSASGRLNQPIVDGRPNNLHAARHIPFLHNVANVRLYGVLTAAQARTDLFGRKAFKKKSEDFSFPDCKHSGVFLL